MTELGLHKDCGGTVFKIIDSNNPSVYAVFCDKCKITDSVYTVDPSGEIIIGATVKTTTSRRKVGITALNEAYIAERGGLPPDE